MSFSFEFTMPRSASSCVASSTAMLRRTLNCFPRFDKNYTEVQHVGRRLLPFPFYPTMIAVRDPQITSRFKDVGPDHDRVFISLGPQMRRRRIGRSTDRKDLRYYWRPVPRGYQRMYLKPARRTRPLIEAEFAPRLHPKPNEQGLTLQQGNRIKAAGLDRIYGGMHAAPLPMDWEYRVY